MTDFLTNRARMLMPQARSGSVFEKLSGKTSPPDFDGLPHKIKNTAFPKRQPFQDRKYWHHLSADNPVQTFLLFIQRFYSRKYMSYRTTRFPIPANKMPSEIFQTASRII